ncbi:S8 family serine peptidase [Nocardia salmonicida]|uniref:S8 family serine peptidase n=1 Tax=Nocardia salmonicida TaxID=53431 RepID=UPI002E2D4639|nr:S8 family serine peptidase [Nocardia salmonicida]
MDRTLKVIANRSEQAALARDHTVTANYDAFALVQVNEAQARELSQRYLVEDITAQYEIPLGPTAEDSIDTNLPRITGPARPSAHPAYQRTRRLDAGPHHYLIQFVGPIKPQWRSAVEKAGTSIVDARAGFTLVVRATAEQIAAIAALPEVRWAGHLPDRARLDVTTEPVLPRTKLLPDVLTVEFFTPATARAGKAKIRKLGLKIIGEGAETLIVEASAGTDAARRKQLAALSAVHGVRMVRNRPINRISNDVAATIMRGTAATLNGVSTLDGDGETIAVCDTGFDTGTTSPVHPDFAGRVKAVMSFPITSEYAQYINNAGADDGASDLDSGHGTHVTGSVLGDGAASTAVAGQAAIRGLATKAKLVFQAVEQALDWKNHAFVAKYGRYLLAGIPVDLADLFTPAYNKGARIHTNSWGGGDPGVYDDQCRAVDKFMWDHPSFCILFAAGNDGSDSDGDGQINLGSVTSPGTAKNCLTVGASENLRRSFDSQRYGNWWPGDYPAPPYKSASMADDPDQVVAFSSRGPTADGRIKPDVVAPGTWILSTKSTMLSPTATGWKPFPGSSKYFYMGGTSMATPLTAGALALLRQYLRRDHSVATPSGALLKAVVIAGARRLPSTAPAATVADNHQGFGCVDVSAVVAPTAPSTLLVRQGKKVSTGQLHTLEIEVTSAAVPLRVVLAYSDFPGETLVNNLNLVVRGPDGAPRAGNSGQGAGFTMDSTNNVEVVEVGTPTVGTWRIDVIGSNVPQGPQPYSLAILGAAAG